MEQLVRLIYLFIYLLSIYLCNTSVKVIIIVDFNEFIFAVCTTSNADLKKRLEWTFKIYDIDRNNSIDKDEFKKIILSIYELITARRCLIKWTQIKASPYPSMNS